MRIFFLALLCCAQISSAGEAWAARRPAGAAAAQKSASVKASSSVKNKAASFTRAQRPSSGSGNTAGAAKGKAVSGKKKGAAPVSRAETVRAYITMNLTGKKIVNSKNADQAIAPASLTKVLTMFVILDQVKSRKVSLDDKVVVSGKASGTGGSSLDLRAGQTVLLRDLLKGMAVVSGNDAAVAAAQHVAGTEAAFVRMMNKKARSLGMKRSIFKNVHGLPAKGQQSTARDMLALSRAYLAAHPQAITLFHSQPYMDFYTWHQNTNPLLGTLEGVDGLKTGFVASSGYNLITTARCGGERLVSVVLGAPNKEVRLREARRLLLEAYAKVHADNAGKKTKPSAKRS
ncbi:MAG: D-alanyl-D-alanine carboxypeptidase [Desulfovibrio sp.]|nr:D-alanyl-D-alanine carboxypeptidase [Desulfovibrio sp.]